MRMEIQNEHSYGVIGLTVGYTDTPGPLTADASHINSAGASSMHRLAGSFFFLSSGHMASFSQ